VLATSQSVPALVNATLTSLKHAVTLAPFPTGSGAGAHHGGTSTPLASPHGGGSGSLANTGAAALTWLGWAIALIAIGGGLMVVSRRSSRLTFWRRH
jgi:LPXTG-motif cell wall-anchored protein